MPSQGPSDVRHIVVFAGVPSVILDHLCRHHGHASDKVMAVLAKTKSTLHDQAPHPICLGAICATVGEFCALMDTVIAKPPTTPESATRGVRNPDKGDGSKGENGVVSASFASFPVDTVWPFISAVVAAVNDGTPLDNIWVGRRGGRSHFTEAKGGVLFTGGNCLDIFGAPVDWSETQFVMPEPKLAKLKDYLEDVYPGYDVDGIPEGRIIKVTAGPTLAARASVCTALNAGVAAIHGVDKIRVFEPIDPSAEAMQIAAAVMNITNGVEQGFGPQIPASIVLVAIGRTTAHVFSWHVENFSRLFVRGHLTGSPVTVAGRYGHYYKSMCPPRAGIHGALQTLDFQCYVTEAIEWAK
jgi:hypothetical protein